MDRQKLLLAIVGGLLLIRFGLVPLQELRAEKVDELNQKVKRFDKGESVLSKVPEYQSKLDELKQSLDRYESLYPAANTSLAAQLTVQEQLQNIAIERNVKLDEVDWISTVEGTPEQATMKIRFTANFKDLMYFVSEAERLGPWLSVSDLNYGVKKQRIGWKKLGEAKGSLILSISYIVNDAA